MKLTQICRYPLKSCAGESLTEAQITQLGVSQDRRFILADQQGQFITARQHPELLQIRVSCDRLAFTFHHPAEPDLRLSPEWAKAFSKVKIWSREVSAKTFNSDINQWFERILKKPVKLIINSDQAQDLAEKRFSWGPIFSDGFPLLVTTQQSLDALNIAIPGQFEMARFRPNLVLDGELPWQEDSWSRLKIGEVILKREQPCERCVLITRDPKTGEKNTHQEPLRTLARIHRLADHGVCFGQNFSVISAGQVSLHDPVELLD